MKLRCDIAVLLMAANLYVNSHSLDLTLVCGCNCLNGSEMYECMAKEEHQKEQTIEKIKKAIEECKEQPK